MNGAASNGALLAAAAFVGLLVPAQAAMNVRIRAHAGHPFAGTAINFWVGSAALAVIVAATWFWGHKFDGRGMAQAPWWAWLGGFIGVGFVTCTVLVVPKTGNAAFTVAVIFGQMLGAVLLDHFGVLGTPQKSADVQRWLGVGCVLVGVWLVVPRERPAPANQAPSAEHAERRP